jgi:hypothetical protein
VHVVRLAVGERAVVAVHQIDFEGRLVTYDVGELDEVALASAATVHKTKQPPA